MLVGNGKHNLFFFALALLIGTSLPSSAQRPVKKSAHF
jgi:hypothetical protein